MQLINHYAQTVAPPQEGADGETAGGMVLNIFDIPSYIYI